MESIVSGKYVQEYNQFISSSTVDPIKPHMKEINHQNIFKTQRPKTSQSKTFTEIDIDKLTIRQFQRDESPPKKSTKQNLSLAV